MPRSNSSKRRKNQSRKKNNNQWKGPAELLADANEVTCRDSADIAAECENRHAATTTDSDGADDDITATSGDASPDEESSSEYPSMASDL